VSQVSSAASAASSALSGLGFGGGSLAGIGGGTGSKPVALHTEYAEEEASGSKPYGGGQDIVFYFIRADQSSGVTDTTNGFGGDQQLGQGPGFNGQANSLTTNALGTNVGGVSQGVIPSNVMGGNNTLLPSVQSGFNQVAAVAGAAGNIASNFGMVGPISNLDKGLSTATSVLGIASAVTTQSQPVSVAEGLGRTIPGATNTPNRAASTSYWDAVSNDAFNPGFERSPFGSPTSEFSGVMAKASGGVDSSTFLKDSAIDGNFFTSPASKSSTVLDFGEAASANPGGLAGGGLAASDDIPSEWYFITAPQEVSWSKDSNTKELDIYGSNSPYLSYSTTKLRKLSLANAMVEGFSNAKAVENNILSLEACMKVIIDESNGYASPYCWNVFAGNKSYGTYIITSIKVNEQMRDLAGKATRAVVDIEFQEVPSYQVSSGNDIAAEQSLGVSSEAFDKISTSQAATQDAKSATAKTTPAAGGGATGNQPGGSQNAAASGPVRSVINPNAGAVVGSPGSFGG